MLVLTTWVFFYGICWYLLCRFSSLECIDTFCVGVWSLEYVGTFCEGVFSMEYVGTFCVGGFLWNVLVLSV